MDIYVDPLFLKVAYSMLGVFLGNVVLSYLFSSSRILQETQMSKSEDFHHEHVYIVQKRLFFLLFPTWVTLGKFDNLEEAKKFMDRV